MVPCDPVLAKTRDLTAWLATMERLDAEERVVDIRAFEEIVLNGYIEGLRDEGWDGDPDGGALAERIVDRLARRSRPSGRSFNRTCSTSAKRR